MKIPYNILIQIKMSVRPYFKGFTLIFSSITVENRIIISSHFLPANKKFTFFSKPASCDETVLLQRNKARSKCLFRWIRKSVDLPVRSFLNGKPHSRFLLPPVSLHASLSRSLCTNTYCIVFLQSRPYHFSFLSDVLY